MSTGFFAIGAIFQVLLVIWVYMDADEHGQDGFIWAVIVLFFGLPALVVYFLFFRQGIAPPRKHKAVSRSEDFTIRARYTGGRGKQDMVGSNGNRREAGVAADPDFTDPDLDRLIAQGKLSEAREWLNDMVEIAKEMNDSKAVRNYRQYQARIDRAARGSSGGFGSRY